MPKSDKKHLSMLKVVRTGATFFVLRHVFGRRMKMQRNFRKKDIVKRLGELALGRSNDSVKLAFLNNNEKGLSIDGLDLKMLSEIRRSATGGVEIKLINRLEVLKTMLDAMEGEPGDEAAAFLNAISGSAGESKTGAD